MKILFLCGSLELGRDGVGDYVRRLAVDLFQQGHQPTAIALNDKYITQEESSFQSTLAYELPVYRLPATWSMGSRFAKAQRLIDDLNPEWISLQFVAFSFHPKGLSFNLAYRLARLGKGRPWHLMLHELWVGMAQGSPLKHIWWGRLQQWLIASLINQLRPVVIHTQTRLYQLQLAKIGVKAGYLPLFSNIPVVRRPEQCSSMPAFGLNAAKTVYLVMFGGIHAGAPVKNIAEEAACYAKKNDVLVVLRIIGRSGAEQEDWVTSWKEMGLPIELFGEQPPERISALLSSSTFGLTTTPLALVEKSGTVAAMKEHGLPVICVRNTWDAREFTSLAPPLEIMEYRVGNFGALLANQTVCVGATTVNEVASIIIDSLQTAKKEMQIKML